MGAIAPPPIWGRYGGLKICILPIFADFGPLYPDNSINSIHDLVWRYIDYRGVTAGGEGETAA